ncbi:MAG: SdiA-regulated domain-containing protein [Bacteroidales bacterium]|nr:SdiA-regulated domain-containing protein [Bacteroidales bacterium]
MSKKCELNLSTVFNFIQMKQVVLLVLMLLLMSSTAQEGQQQKDDEAVSIYRVLKPDGRRFDLSGLAWYNDTIVAVADKPWNTWLYHIELREDHTATAKPWQEIGYDSRADFEAVDYSGGCFFVADERASSIIKVNPALSGKSKTLDISWGVEENFSEWGNAGIEGLALYPHQKKLYIAKERDPARLFVVSHKGGETEEVKLVKTPAGFDIADMKYAEGCLYFLNRHNFTVMKWDIANQKWGGSYDYSYVMNAGGEMLYSNSQYPMAEGLLLDEEFIWIALDNNGRSFNSKNRWIEKYGFTGDDPVIVRFKRPENF